jgi:hypothetical protein
MANTILSPNMDMPVPIVGVDFGPDWAQNLNACLSIIDGHNHSLGTGVQITPNGLNINSDLTIQSNNLTFVRTVRFAPQLAALSGPSDVGCIYEVGVDLYYNDGNGNQIRITQGGSVAGASGTITGLPSGTASASYSSGTFIFQSATNVPATMDIGSLIVRNETAGANGVTISPVNSLGASYNLILPTLPSSQKIMTLDSAGNITAPYTVDGSTIVITSNVIGVAAGGIGNTQLAANAVQVGNIATSVFGLSLNATTVTYSSAGTYTFVAPATCTRIIVEACGGGGGGGSTGSGAGQGGNSLFNGIIVGRGGSEGIYTNGASGGVGTTASNNTDSYFGGNGDYPNSNPGEDSLSFIGGAGGFNGVGGSPGGGGGASDYGDGGNGGFGGGINAGGQAGQGPGAGGGGAQVAANNIYAGGGAGAKKWTRIFNVIGGNSYTVIVGAGGAGGLSGGYAAGGAGADGQVIIYY